MTAALDARHAREARVAAAAMVTSCLIHFVKGVRTLHVRRVHAPIVVKRASLDIMGCTVCRVWLAVRSAQTMRVVICVFLESGDVTVTQRVLKGVKICVT